MTKEKIPSTPAIRVLRKNGVDFTPRPYRYEDRGGAKVAARELKCDEHQMVKTLVMEDEHKNSFIILMHGDMHASTKELARAIGVKSVIPCDPRTAQKHTGYMVGGTSPFGIKRDMPIYMEESIVDLASIFINAGRRGLLVEMQPAELVRILGPGPVRVGT
ncbi:MAG: aminoacyl-tRNA deacylase [Deltaproteobacteria bacterium]|nr:aminoacyl-tRNA deacylase [Deltaproteobacteria bacterium]MBW2595286.1 aminoacyl-tRNA deacylase [Deltaproteobacteria bacterium]